MRVVVTVVGVVVGVGVSIGVATAKASGRSPRVARGRHRQVHHGKLRANYRGAYQRGHAKRPGCGRSSTHGRGTVISTAAASPHRYHGNVVH